MQFFPGLAKTGGWKLEILLRNLRENRASITLHTWSICLFATFRINPIFTFFRNWIQLRAILFNFKYSFVYIKFHELHFHIVWIQRNATSTRIIKHSIEIMLIRCTQCVCMCVCFTCRLVWVPLTICSGLHICNPIEW